MQLEKFVKLFFLAEEDQEDEEEKEDKIDEKDEIDEKDAPKYKKKDITQSNLS